MLVASKSLTSDNTKSHNNQNSMVLTQKQSVRPKDRNRRCRLKPMQQSTDFQQRCPKHMMGKRASSRNVAAKTG
jgi:hypothetical protein